jgi:hypothetical protein
MLLPIAQLPATRFCTCAELIFAEPTAALAMSVVPTQPAQFTGSTPAGGPPCAAAITGIDKPSITVRIIILTNGLIFTAILLSSSRAGLKLLLAVASERPESSEDRNSGCNPTGKFLLRI